MTNPLALAGKGLDILRADLDELNQIDDYIKGRHIPPYMPPNADNEFKTLADRAVTNWMPLVVDSPTQMLYVDSYQRSVHEQRNIGEAAQLPEWEHWQNSSMDARQTAVHRSAITYGHSFVHTYRKGDKVLSRGLSPRRTFALYDDPATDIDPVAGGYVRKWPTVVDGKPADGVLTFWDEWFEYEMRFKPGEKPHTIVSSKRHGASQCPLTRFAAYVDLDGRTWGVVKPLIPIQDRINQTVFDLLMAQSYTSFEVRTVTGMAPPIKYTMNEDGVRIPELDDEGNPIPDHQFLNASRWFYAEDADVKFGSLPGGKLGGFVETLDAAIRQLSAISQVPPHFLLGQIANVSAEALEAAMTALLRKVQDFQHTFGESWERVLRIALEMGGEETSMSGEVMWRDMSASSIAQVSDALGKLAQNLQVPSRALWPRVPGMTRQELERWEQIKEDDDLELQVMQKQLQAQGTTQATTTTSRFGSRSVTANDGADTGSSNLSATS